jgi:hypothetical protein
MITDHVPAVRVPPDHAASRGATASPACGDVEDRRDLVAAPPARRPAAPPAAPPEAELGGPGPARGPARRDAESAAPGTAAAGHPGHDRVRWHRDIVRRRWAARSRRGKTGRQAGHPAEHQSPRPAAGPREPRMGLPQDPRRTGRPRTERGGVDGMGDSEEGRNRPAPRRTRPAWSQFLRSQAEASWRAISSRPTCSTAPRPMFWP